jgi:hypothetical protein
MLKVDKERRRITKTMAAEKSKLAGKRRTFLVESSRDV